MKKLRFAFVLLLCLGVFLCLCSSAYAEPAVIDSGTCGADGDNLTWTLYDTGELVIDGTGAMADYEYYYHSQDDQGCTAPWYENRLEINTVTIRDDVTSISDYAFEGCSSLTSVTIPDSVTSIGRYTFSYCSSLTSVTIPDSVTSIGEGAFSECSSLTSVTIPEGVTSIGEGAFVKCGELMSIFVDPANASFCDLDGVLFDISMKTIICFPDGRAGAYDIPEGVKRIGWGAFYGCSGLTSVTIPDSVTSIGEGAFYGCFRLKSVTIPEGVTSIGDFAFWGCSSLTSVTIPEGVTSIGGSAFSECNGLTSVTIPEGVTSIGGSAFDRCSSLTDVYYGGSEAQWETISIENGNIPLKNATIHYGWIPEIYTVSYDPNGGKDAPASQQKVQTVPLTLSNVHPTKENTGAGTYSVSLNPNDGEQPVSVLNAERTTSYSFKSWNTAADGSGTGYAPGASYTADADVTLYAQWESTTKTAPVTLPELARDDGFFKGWAESRNAESGIIGEYPPTGNVTLYAIWLKADFILPASLNTVESEAFTGGAFTYVFIPETVARIEGGAFASCPKLAYAQFAGADTVIDSSAFDGVTGLTIIAPGGSTAETFAAAHGFNFMPAA